MSARSILRSLILPAAAFVALAVAPAVAQVKTSCPPYPGTYVKLVNQPYALCAGATTVNFDEVTYAKCKRLTGTSISAEQKYPFPANGDFLKIPRSGNIATVNKGTPMSKGYVVSTYSPPAGAIAPRQELALYTCDQGAYAQCDGGLCFSSTTGKSSPLWGKVGKDEIICSCPITVTQTPFQVFGPGQCPTTQAAYDAICAKNVSRANNGAVLYIGSPVGGPEALAQCLQNAPVNFRSCYRPAS